MAKKAREKFRDGERHIHGQAEKRGAQTALEAFRRHEEL
jgi:hypothetical protein